MKEIYRNPTLYYVLVPIIVALWPLLVWAVYLPRADKGLGTEQKQYMAAQEVIEEILTLDPARLESRGGDTDGAEFDYVTDVGEIARLCEISPRDYELRSKKAKDSKAKGQKTQNCNVVLRAVDITRFAKFLSTIQLRWPSLQCDRIVLTKQRGLPDTWKVNLDFKYYY